MIPDYKIYYKRYSTLGQYVVNSAKNIKEVSECIKDLLCLDDCYDITLEASIRIKLDGYTLNDCIDETIEAFDNRIIKD